jgi:hypothetical protein
MWTPGASQPQRLLQREKNQTGRQLARVSVVRYRETLWSDLYPGNRHTTQCLQPAVLATETALELTQAQRRRTVWRLDGGAGSDAHLRWLLARGYHVVAKGTSNRRAEALARQVRRWDAYRDVWLGEVPPPTEYGRPVRVFVKRRPKEQTFVHSYYVSTLSLPAKGLYLAGYDARGGAEVEQFRQDKSGLHLAARRKRRVVGQLAFVLLTDLAHNLLADLARRGLADSVFHGYGLKRIVRDLLAIPGRLVFEGETLIRVELLSQNQFAQALAPCLARFCSGP